MGQDDAGTSAPGARRLTEPPPSESEQERYLAQILEHVSDAVVATDTQGRVTFSNPAAQKLYGIAGEEAEGRQLLELLDLFDAGGSVNVETITRVVAHEGQWHGELNQRSLDGRDLLVEASVSILTDDDGEVLGSVSVLREISGRKAAERQISYQATHDGLTGLLNRTAFLAELDESLSGGRRPTLIFIDLNGFKAINDLHGHDRGDEILRVIGNRLAGGLRPGDAAGRFGGDEFVLMAHGLTERAIADAYLQRIMGLFADPVRCRGGGSHTVGVSVGVAHATLDDDSDALFRRADGAMYEAKRSTEVASAFRTA
jgi:diguanylate cyclase (GGDEF)-like protein/PAS domain S-box-containing protein